MLSNTHLANTLLVQSPAVAWNYDYDSKRRATTGWHVMDDATAWTDRRQAGVNLAGVEALTDLTLIYLPIEQNHIYLISAVSLMH